MSTAAWQGLEELVARVTAGDPAGGEELVNRYGRAVRAVAERYATPECDADDLYQQVFMIVLQKIRAGDLREPARLSGFVLGVARNVAIDAVRRLRRYEQPASIAEPAAPAPSAVDELLADERRGLLRCLLNGLRNREREVLDRFYLSEEPKSSICNDLGLKSLQFDQVLFAARQRYRILYRAAMERKTGKKWK